MTEASNSDPVSTKQQRIAELAQQAPQMGFTSLNHHIDLWWLFQAFLRTRQDGAPGTDGQTAEDYGADWQDNLQSLLDRAKSGTYRAPPVRRVHIPKGAGTTETRPIGIPTIRDRVVQMAAVLVLEPIFEADLQPEQYAYRAERSAQDAVRAVQGLLDQGCTEVVDADLSGYFDTLDHAHLRNVLAKRVRDGVLLRLIGKWLNAGVLEDGEVSYPDQGTPQGGGISPLLANVYLHYVLDEWFERDVKPCLRGRAFLIRYADDFVMGFACEDDARRVLEVLPKRFGKYGLTIHPDKTRLVPFAAPGQSLRDDSAPGDGPGTFDFLGCTHYWGQSRKGNAVVIRQTAASRFHRAVRKIAEWCRRNCHRPLPEQHATLSRKLRGHYGYYGITGNGRALANFRYVVARIWRQWLSRRSWAGCLSWLRFERVRAYFALPPPIVVHSVYRQAAKL